MEHTDVEICATFINRRMLFEPNRLHNPSVTDAARISGRAAIIRADLDNPETVQHVAKMEGKVVGWTSWVKPGVPGAAKKAVPTPANKERDYEKIQAVAKQMEEKRAHFLGNKPSWYLHQLFVDPNVRRAGVGLKLVRYGVSLIGNAPADLSSSPTASGLYRQCGFRIVSWWQFDVEDVDEQGETCMYRYRWPYMANYWVGKEQEVEAAERRRPYEGKLAGDPEL